LFDVKHVAVTLSGGLDSRAVLYCARELGADISAYTFGVPGSRDAVVAKALADRCGIPHLFIEADGSHLDRWLKHTIFVTGGMIGAMHFQIMSLVGTMLERGEKLILDGLGGDAWTGSYLRPQNFLSRSFEKSAEFVLRLRSSGWSELNQILETDYVLSTEYRPRQAIERHVTSSQSARPWMGCQAYYLLENQRRFTQSGPLLVEPFMGVRTPFYGNGVPEAALGFGPFQLVEQRVHVAMHAQHMRFLAQVPDALRGIRLTNPQWIRFGKKVLDAGLRKAPRLIRNSFAAQPPPMTRYANWFQSRLKDGMREQLLDGCSGLKGVVRLVEVDRIIREHESGVRDHSARIGILLALTEFVRMTKPSN